MQYVQACDRTIYMEYCLIVMSFFKVILTCSFFFSEHKEKMVLLWLKIVIFYDFFEICHSIIVIRYLNKKYAKIHKSFKDFLTYAENNLRSARTNIVALDILREANSSLKYTNFFNILNKT